MNGSEPHKIRLAIWCIVLRLLICTDELRRKFSSKYPFLQSYTYCEFNPIQGLLTPMETSVPCSVFCVGYKFFSLPVNPKVTMRSIVYASMKLLFRPTVLIVTVLVFAILRTS